MKERKNSLPSLRIHLFDLFIWAQPSLSPFPSPRPFHGNLMQVRCVEHGRFVLKRRAANNLRFIEMHRAESLVILFPPFPPPFSSKTRLTRVDPLSPPSPWSALSFLSLHLLEMGRRGKMVGRWNYDCERSDRAIVPKLEWKKVGVEGKEKEKRRGEGGMRLRAKRRVPDIAPSKLTLRLTSATKVKISLEIYSKLYSIWGEREREQLWWI